MKTAILFRGQLRTYEKTLESYQKAFTNCDIFFHTWNQSGVKVINKKNQYNTDIVDVKQVVNKIKPKSYLITDLGEFIEEEKKRVEKFLKKFNRNFKDEILFNTTLHSIFCQFYSFEQVVNLFLEEDIHQYDKVVLTRFDYKYEPVQLRLTSKEIIVHKTKWHNYPKDFIYIFTPDNIKLFKGIYSDIVNINSWNEIKNPFRQNLPNPELWAYGKLKKSNLKKDFKLQGNLIRHL